jgi:hypothetical protein
MINVQTMADELYECAGIKDISRYLHEIRLKSWGWLKGAFVRESILPTDIDGLVEVNGKFLLFENKYVGATMSNGQRQTLEKLVLNADFVVVRIDWDGAGRVVRFERWVKIMPVGTIDIKNHENATEKDIRELCLAWSKWAQSNPRN